MELDKSLLLGRRLLLSELPYEKERLLSDCSVKSVPAMVKVGHVWKCIRCGSSKNKLLRSSPEKQVYCTSCLMLGRITNLDKLYTYDFDESLQSKVKEPLDWHGVLSVGQQMASEKVVSSIKGRTDLLIHAVTGAGKTEMLFQGIAYALENGLKVGMASPRVDVCLELYPRLQAAFPKTELSLLHGRQEEKYAYSQFVILTCHQLFRFYHAFDVLIIDEVDAFPYLNDRELDYATREALKPTGVFIYLSATPPRHLMMKTKRGELSLVTVPNRYHGHALPVPKFKWIWHWETLLTKGKLPQSLERILEIKAKQKRQLLIFCPSIKLIENLVAVTRKMFKEIIQECSYASDEHRLEKVQLMRERGCQWFFTSTILERGVTFPEVDVIVVGADHLVFNKHGLIQIAGRAGRSVKDPVGEVYFLGEGRSLAMVQARQEILKMNRLARKRGLLK